MFGLSQLPYLCSVSAARTHCQKIKRKNQTRRQRKSEGVKVFKENERISIRRKAKLKEQESKTERGRERENKTHGASNLVHWAPVCHKSPSYKRISQFFLGPFFCNSIPMLSQLVFWSARYTEAAGTRLFENKTFLWRTLGGDAAPPSPTQGRLLSGSSLKRKSVPLTGCC